MDTVILPDSPPLDGDLDHDPAPLEIGELTDKQREILEFLHFHAGLDPHSEADRREVADYLDSLDDAERSFFSRHARRRP